MFRELYEDHRVDNYLRKAYLLFFLIRRFIYVTIGIYFVYSKQGIIQIVLTMILKLITIIYLGAAKALKKQRLN
jgi:hypothetical protein